VLDTNESVGRPIVLNDATRRDAAPASLPLDLTPIDLRRRLVPVESITPQFEIYTRMPRRTSPRVWAILRWIGLAGAVALIAASVLAPAVALRLFWDGFVTALPLLLLAAPGFWRNVCPIATLNQLPLGLSRVRRWSIPAAAQRHAPAVSAGLFLLIVPLRTLLLDDSGVALGGFVLLLLAIGSAGGVLFRGKSGWCSLFCPMLPIERFYGQSPLTVVRNSHCRPCVGCSTNCYDFNPTAAALTDLHGADRLSARYRNAIAGAMPWVVIAFFTQRSPESLTLATISVVYVRILAFAATGVAVFLLLRAATRLTSTTIGLGHVVLALNLFYWFAIQHLLVAAGVTIVVVPAVLQAAVAAISIRWLWRAWPRERRYLRTPFTHTKLGSIPRRQAAVGAPVAAPRGPAAT
jgi:nitrite reductase (NADH) large subunit